MKVYIAGPMTGDLGGNVAAGIKLGQQMVRDGLAPFIPHLDAYMFWTMPDDYEILLDWDFAWIQASDVMFRMDGPSPGADREVALAQKLGLPVFNSYRALLLFAELNGRLAGKPRMTEDASAGDRA